MATLSNEEIKALSQFRTCLAEMEISLDAQDVTDLRLLAWLRIQDFKIPAAAAMLKKSLEWRKENEISMLLSWEPPQNFPTDFPYKICGRDDAGRAILVMPFGLWEIRRVIGAGGKEVFLKFVMQMFERIQAALRFTSEELGKEVTQFVAIVDCDNFSITQILSLSTVEAMLEMLRRFEANYPQFLYRAYIINSSKIWLMAFELLKPIMSKYTTERLEMFSEAAVWKPRLLDHLPADQIPKEYGGLQ